MTTAATTIEAGATYFGFGCLGQVSLELVCVKRTPKTAWFLAACCVGLPTATPTRCRVWAWSRGRETTCFRGWYVTSEATTPDFWEQEVARWRRPAA